MKLNQKAFGLSSAILSGVLYVICTIFVVFWPDFSRQILDWLLHQLPALSDFSITWGGFIAGLILFVVFAYVTGWIFAWLYNRMLKPQM